MSDDFLVDSKGCEKLATQKILNIYFTWPIIEDNKSEKLVQWSGSRNLMDPPRLLDKIGNILLQHFFLLITVLSALYVLSGICNWLWHVGWNNPLTNLCSSTCCPGLLVLQKSCVTQNRSSNESFRFNELTLIPRQPRCFMFYQTQLHGFY